MSSAMDARAAVNARNRALGLLSAESAHMPCPATPQPSPQEHPMSLITEALDALHAAEAKLALLGHTAAAKVRAVITELDADALSLGQKAWADLRQAEADAKGAAAPVVAEVEQDAVDLTAEAKADAAQVIADAKS